MLLGQGRPQGSYVRGHFVELGSPIFKVLDSDFNYAKHIAYRSHMLTHGAGDRAAYLNILQQGNFFVGIPKMLKSFHHKCNKNCKVECLHCHLCRISFARTKDQRNLIKLNLQSSSRRISDIAVCAGHSQINIDILGPLYHNISGETVKFFFMVAATSWIQEAHFIAMEDQSTRAVVRALIQLSYKVGQLFI